MKFKIHYNGFYEDEIVVSGDTIEEVQKQAMDKVNELGWEVVHCWSEEIVEFDEETQSCKVKRIKTGDNAEKALEVYDKLSSENKRYFGTYENFSMIALDVDMNEFIKFEKGNYIKLVQPLLERGK